jgi:hypothetical protein
MAGQSRVKILTEIKDFSLLQTVQIGFAAQRAFYLMRTKVLYYG